MPVVFGMMVQGKGITAKRGAGFCFRAVHQRGMAATGRDVRCGSDSEVGPAILTSTLPSTADIRQRGGHVRKVPIVLQKSNVAGLKILGENTEQRAVADSYDLNRVTEVACEFCVRT
jgi:hypothetical protein